MKPKMTLCDKIRKVTGSVLSAGAVITMLSGWPAHLVRNTYVGRVEDKTYVSGNINTQSGGRIDVLLESNARKRFILDDSLLEWKLGSARDYQKITRGEKYCFETYGFERATDENLIPYLYGLHIVEVKPVAECK